MPQMKRRQRVVDGLSRVSGLGRMGDLAQSAKANPVVNLTAKLSSKILTRFAPYRQKGVALEIPSRDGMQPALSPPVVVPVMLPVPEPYRILASGGRFEVRVTRQPEDIAAAQGLRYRIFYEEMQAQPTPAMASARRDFDTFDHLCDHLMVLDHQRAPGDRVVGTYRLLRQAVAEQHGGFYSAGEYDISPLSDSMPDANLLELGRSCVHADYRTNATIQLLWRGIATYMIEHRITHMFGCASFPGTDPMVHALPLSYLHHYHACPPDLQVRALPERYAEMNRLPADEVQLRAAMQAMPPLIKAYLRLGAYIGAGAVVDHQFGTTDVFILLPVDRIGEKYLSHFDREEGRAPAA